MDTTPIPRHAARLCGLVVSLLVLVVGCDTGPGSSLYDPGRTAAPAPVIASVEPAGSALAGVDILTIRGENFSPDVADNYVYFNEVRGQVIEASPTQLRVRPPNLPRPELQVRVMVLGAAEFSNAITYRLDAAAERFSNIGRQEEPFGITTDEAGNLYVSLFAEGRSIGIKRITPEGVRSDYISTTTLWTGLDFGPDGALYGVRGVQAIFRLPEGGSQEVWAVLPSTARLNAIEFDTGGALWAASRTGTIYRVSPDMSVQAFSVTGTIQDIALFGGHLYAAVTRGSVSQVLRFAITEAGELGPEEVYAGISGPVGAEALALAFAADGGLLIGTGGQPALAFVPSGGAAESFYPGIVRGPVSALAWGAGTGVYAVGRVAGDADSRDRELPDLIRIEARREGA